MVGAWIKSLPRRPPARSPSQRRRGSDKKRSRERRTRRSRGVTRYRAVEGLGEDNNRNIARLITTVKALSSYDQTSKGGHRIAGDRLSALKVLRKAPWSLTNDQIVTATSLSFYDKRIQIEDYSVAKSIDFFACARDDLNRTPPTPPATI